MKRNKTAVSISAAALIGFLGVAAVPAMVLAAEDDGQAEREARRIENEARRQQEMARRQIEDRERIQAEAIRGQEEAIRRMEATRSRIEANTQQMAEQSVEQARAYGYPYSSSYPPVASSPAPANPVSGMSFATLSERLGNYFGTRSGVLVVRAGANAPFGLQDGDVILSIDGRVPTDDQHAASILRSYRPGEPVKLQVQRERRAITVDTTAPGQRSN